MFRKYMADNRSIQERARQAARRLIPRRAAPIEAGTGGGGPPQVARPLHDLHTTDTPPSQPNYTGAATMRNLFMRRTNSVAPSGGAAQEPLRAAAIGANHDYDNVPYFNASVSIADWENSANTFDHKLEIPLAESVELVAPPHPNIEHYLRRPDSRQKPPEADTVEVLHGKGQRGQQYPVAQAVPSDEYGLNMEDLIRVKLRKFSERRSRALRNVPAGGARLQAERNILRDMFREGYNLDASDRTIDGVVSYMYTTTYRVRDDGGI